jgi:hypothetical protein
MSCLLAYLFETVEIREYRPQFTHKRYLRAIPSNLGYGRGIDISDADIMLEPSTN